MSTTPSALTLGSQYEAPSSRGITTRSQATAVSPTCPSDYLTSVNVSATTRKIRPKDDPLRHLITFANYEAQPRLEDQHKPLELSLADLSDPSQSYAATLQAYIKTLVETQARRMIIDTIRCGIEGESRNPPEDEVTEEQLAHMTIGRARYIKDSEMDSLADLSDAVDTLMITNRELKLTQAAMRDAYDLKGRSGGIDGQGA